MSHDCISEVHTTQKFDKSMHYTRVDLLWVPGAPPPSLVSTLPLNFVSWKRHWPVSGWWAEGPDGENRWQEGYSSGIKG